MLHAVKELHQKSDDESIHVKRVEVQIGFKIEGQCQIQGIQEIYGGGEGRGGSGDICFQGPGGEGAESSFNIGGDSGVDVVMKLLFVI